MYACIGAMVTALKSQLYGEGDVAMMCKQANLLARMCALGDKVFQTHVMQLYKSGE